MIVTNNGASCAAIVVPYSPSKVESFAAHELQRYLEKISGARLPVIDDEEVHNLPADTGLICIGSPAHNRQSASFISPSDFASQVPGPEGMYLSCFSDTLILAGSTGTALERDRGCLYAVYEFLETYLGCLFAAYGACGSTIGEVVPRQKTIELPDFTDIQPKCSLLYRGAVVQYDSFQNNALPGQHPLSASLIDWMGKNRLNRIMLMMSSYETISRSPLLEEIEKRGICLTVGHHESGMFFLPPHGSKYFPEEYYVTHPEYYRLQEDGTRYEPTTKWDGQLIFEMHSQACIETIAQNMLAWHKKNPYVDTLNFWPNDLCRPQCCCPECSSHSKSENYAYMCNAIAAILRQQDPDLKIDMIIYHDIRQAPESVKFQPNVVLDESTWGPQYIRNLGTNDGSGLIGSETERTALEWSKLNPHLVYYDYYMTNFGSLQVYCPMADEICAIYEHFVKTGYCMGSATQMECYNLWNYLFNFFVHGRKGYDVRLSLTELADRFSRLFGAAASYVKEYLLYVEDFSNGQPGYGNACAKYFASHVDRVKVYSLFEKGLSAIEEDAKKTQNLQIHAQIDALKLLRMAFRYSDLLTNDPENDELVYMSTHFGSLWSALGQSGYGISIVPKPGESQYVPDKWYDIGS